MINHIEINPEWVELCGLWHSGQDDLLYAVSSTGGLTTGSYKPPGCETDEQWYLGLWRCLSADVGAARRAAASCDDGDYEALNEFEEWIDEVVIPKLAAEYNLVGWECE